MVEGVIVRFPEVSVPAQNTLPSWAFFRVKVVLLPDPPLTEFQITWTLPIVIVSCGFVIDKLIVLPVIRIDPVVMLSQPSMAVEVMVGVNVRVGVIVSVGASVAVAVGVIVGTSVGVPVGQSVAVATTCPEVVAVDVGVSAGTVSVGVAEGAVVPGVVGTLEVGVFGELELSNSRST